MTNNSCSVLIRCFNEEKFIGKLLTGIMKQTIKDVEIIIVDSGSTDATLSIAVQFPVKILSIKSEDFSFGRALNIGCRSASNEVIVFASAHVYPIYNDWLELMINPFQKNEVGLVYGKQRGNELTQYSEQQVFRKWFPNSDQMSENNLFCNNANAAIRKSIWDKIPYDEELTGLEDLEWAKNISEKGFKIIYTKNAGIIHVHEETYSQIKNRYKREAIAFKSIYPGESFSFIHFIWMFLSNTISDYYHSISDGKFFHALASIPLFRINQFWGTYSGYQQAGDVSRKLKNHFYFPHGFFREKEESTVNKNDRLIKYDHN
ncbi:glycosyltransferase [Caldithrix abyssi]|nr:glycosyltransferase [Caldithrix abyssi]